MHGSFLVSTIQAQDGVVKIPTLSVLQFSRFTNLCLLCHYLLAALNAADQVSWLTIQALKRKMQWAFRG